MLISIFATANGALMIRDIAGESFSETLRRARLLAVILFATGTILSIILLSPWIMLLIIQDAAGPEGVINVVWFGLGSWLIGCVCVVFAIYIMDHRYSWPSQRRLNLLVSVCLGHTVGVALLAFV